MVSVSATEVLSVLVWICTYDGKIAIDSDPINLHKIPQNINNTSQQPPLNNNNLTTNIQWGIIALEYGTGFHDNNWWILAVGFRGAWNWYWQVAGLLGGLGVLGGGCEGVG